MSIETVLRFAELGLPAPVLRAIEALGYETPSPIQARSIPPLIAGRDLLGRAQTGTGKTAAFALPLLSTVDTASPATQALVLTPTRELAIQVAEAIHAYGRHLDDLHVLPIYGGQPIGPQLRSLRRGVHVVVGTPGRVIDHLERGTLKLDALRTVVLDEADEMLRMGFIEDVDRILEATPPERQVALFSATMPSAVRRVADRHLRDPEIVTIEAPTSTVEATEQRFLVAPWRQKLDVLTRVLETTEYDGMLVFVRTKIATVELAEKLEARGHAAACLHGDMTQSLRERTVQRLKDGALDIVVATDVAARGLDVDRITHVVNYDVPSDPEAYVHRIGRTGRAGREGTALLFVQPRERRMLRTIERATGRTIEPYQPPTASDVSDHRVKRFRATVLAALEAGPDRRFFDEVLAPLRDEHGHSIEDIAAALAELLQADRPLQPELPEIETYDAARERAGHREHRDRTDRRDRREHGRPDGPPRRDTGRPAPSRPGEMVPYRVDVGRRHGLRTGHLVGALTNEGGLTGADIGRIEIREDHTLLGLDPRRVDRDLYRLAGIILFGHRLGLRPDDGRPGRPPSSAPRPGRTSGGPAARPPGARPEGRYVGRSASTPGGTYTGKPGGKHAGAHAGGARPGNGFKPRSFEGGRGTDDAPRARSGGTTGDMRTTGKPPKTKSGKGKAAKGKGKAKAKAGKGKGKSAKRKGKAARH